MLQPVGTEMVGPYQAANPVLAEAKKISFQSMAVEINIGKEGDRMTPNIANLDLENV
jgi:hypothetical protein